MGSNEKFCLRWNDFESNISVAFREIRDEKDFFDITLSCGQRQIQAHKLILSACSPFFRTVLKQNPHQHPLLYLKGVEFSDLQAVLNFMYHGEVNVAQEELNSFLSVAEELQVKGLTQKNSPSNSNPKSEHPPAPVPRPRPPPREPEVPSAPKRARPVSAASAPSQPAYQPSQPDDIQEITPLPVVKTEPEPALYPTNTISTQGEFGEQGGLMKTTMGTEVASMEDTYVEEGYDDYGGYEGQGYDGGDGQGYGGQEYRGDGGAGQQGLLDGDIDSQIDKHIQNNGNEWICTECGKSVKNRMTLRNHIEAQHIVTPGFQCNICGFVSKTRHALRGHKDYNHKVKK